MVSKGLYRRTFLVVCILVVAIATAAAQGVTKPKQGQGGSAVQGSAGTDGSSGDSGLEHCDKPMGALAVVEPQNEVLVALTRYRLSSPVGLIRMMVQQSNCFIVVERGQGLRNMEQERALAGAECGALGGAPGKDDGGGCRRVEPLRSTQVHRADGPVDDGWSGGTGDRRARCRIVRRAADQQAQHGNEEPTAGRARE